MSKQFRVGDRVEVFWLDTTGRGRWEPIAELQTWSKKHPVEHKSCGYVLSIDKERVALIQSSVTYDATSEPMGSDAIVFPRRVITRMKKLR